MSWAERLRPRRMQRVAVVAPQDRLHGVLELVGRCGVVQLDLGPGRFPTPGSSGGLEQRPAQPGVDVVAARAVRSGPIAAIVGWMLTDSMPALTEAVGAAGGAVAPLPAPRRQQPPTLLPAGRARRSFDLLVETYATVPYVDVDPALVAGLAYALMFGIMFGDVGHGGLLLLGALLLRAGRLPGAARLHRAWPFLAGGGLVSMVFGLLYGEAFGPTGLMPAVWLEPLDRPVPLLLAAIGIGAVLLAGAYALGTVNRLREGGWGYALYARSGIAGALLFLALGLAAGGGLLGIGWLLAAGLAVALVALGLALVGLLAEAGGGPGAGVQAVVELVDLVIRLCSNVVSFARLAAFGLTHAALGAVVWQATTAVSGSWLGTAVAVLVFVVGNAVTFGLEALVAGVQALRLEYYELFSRVFAAEGRPFRPWVLPDQVPVPRPGTP